VTKKLVSNATFIAAALIANGSEKVVPLQLAGGGQLVENGAACHARRIAAVALVALKISKEPPAEIVGRGFFGESAEVVVAILIAILRPVAFGSVIVIVLKTFLSLQSSPFLKEVGKIRLHERRSSTRSHGGKEKELHRYFERLK
jgi:hypothetical protein